MPYADPEKRRAASRESAARRRKDPDVAARDRERSRRYYEDHRDEILARLKRKYDADPEPSREQSRQAGKKLRREMLDAYGKKCACCGETEEIFLCLDHVNGNGGEERRLLSNGRPWSNVPVLRRLKKAGWPQEGYRILCANCNMATMHARVCPHQSGREQ